MQAKPKYSHDYHKAFRNKSDVSTKEPITS